VRAIELNGVSVDANKRAFEWGRAAVHDPAAVLRAAAAARGGDAGPPPVAATLEEVAALRGRFLTAYQDAALAGRYARLVERVAQAERACMDGGAASATPLALAVARNYFKLLAVKDEYEVARLHRDPAFRAAIGARFTGRYRVHFHLAPPLLARRDPVSGTPRKMRLGPWMAGVFAVLAPLRFLRGTPFDPFGHSAERRMERALVREYESLVAQLLEGLTRQNLPLAVRLAGFPDEIRGFGHVKLRSLERVRPQLAAWRQQWAAQAGAADGSPQAAGR